MAAAASVGGAAWSQCPSVVPRAPHPTCKAWCSACHGVLGACSPPPNPCLSQGGTPYWCPPAHPPASCRCPSSPHAGLHSEQLALLDLLVLTGAQAFVGHPFSTMSVLVEHLRTCQGVDRRTAHYITVKHPRLQSYVESYSAHLHFMGDYKPDFKPQAARGAAAQARLDPPPPSRAPPPTIPAAAP